VTNKLPPMHYVVCCSIRKLGLNYNNVHACPDGCVLYEEENAILNTCPKCSKSRWMEGNTTIVAKIIKHFLLIPRLKYMWRSKEITGMLIGHTKPCQHLYWRSRRFNGNVEHRTSPPTMSGLDIIRYTSWRQSYLDQGG